MYPEYASLMSPWGAPAPEVRPQPNSAGAHLAEILATFELMQRDLRDELLRIVYNHDPSFFEHLVIDVLLALGYGGRRRDLARCLGRSGDGGIDGVIARDELGLDQVFVQAKRLRPGTAVAIGDVRDFAGSLDAQHAAQGVFVTTAHFSPGAANFCKLVSRRVALVDGNTLADLMIRHNIGVTVEKSFQVKRVDSAYFRQAAARGRAR